MANDRSKRPLTIAAVGLVVILVAIAAYFWWPRKPDHVLLVGDSVSYLSLRKIKATFGDEVSVEPITKMGYRSSDLLPLATKAIDDRAAQGKVLDRAIFLVGYNDVMRGNLETTDLDRLVDESARYECAIWLTLPVEPAGRPSATEAFDPIKATAWNERLAELVGEHDNLHLVTGWQDAVDGAEPDQYLEPDGVHPNDAGAQKLADVMADSLLSDCRFA